MESLGALEKGIINFACDNFAEAIKNFDEAFKSSHSFDAFICRSKANQALKKYDEAFEDLEQADKLTQNKFEVFYRKGIVQFHLEKFLNSNESFKRALQLSSNSEERDKLVLWTNKLEIELTEHGLIEESTTPDVSDTQFKAVTNWFQSSTHITLTLNSNIQLDGDEFKIDIEKRTIRIRNIKTSSTLWEMSLSNTVAPDNSSYKIKHKTVEFSLKKEIEHFNWVTIDRTNTSSVSSDFKPSYPSSAKNKKDWGDLEQQIDQEIFEDEKNNSMMFLFKQIYERGNEETRRAMMKSFQTSGGTVLSTNWGEVKEKDYEGKDRPDAPEGQKWAK